MDCASCGRPNRAGARFCGGCGGPLAPRCPACGSECEPGAGFCDACGTAVTPVAPAAEAAEARKVVTIVFADLIGSTALHERLDAESTRAFMDRYYHAMRGAVEAHGGRVTQFLGDGVKAVFGAPRVAEDDAVRAVRAAAGMQRAFRALADAHSEVVGEVGLRVAVNTGEVVADDETEIIGDPVNVAARLQQEARDGDVLLGEWTQRLVSQLVTLEPFGTFTLKGRAGSVAAWRVVSLERPAGAPASAFVGRDEELRRITAVYEAAVVGPHARLAVILGSPGLGKSRLLAEIGHRLGDRAAVLYARCDAAGGATFAPIAEALRALLRVEAGAGGDGVRAAIDAALPGDPAERARVADGVAALLAGTPASPEETFFVVRRLLSALAAKQPVVLAIDDLQWAEPLLLDLCEHLVQWSSGVPLLLLAAARPELRDKRSSLATPGGLVADVLTLSGLDAGAATRLAANVVGAEALPAAIAGRVLATSEGNPLFVGELVRMLVQDGALRREGDRWTAGVELAKLEMPPTIHALLAARIERLRPEERSVLERAAVVGRHFSRAAVAELLPREQHANLDARLESLRRSELIEPDTGWLLGDPVLRFHHVLIRDAAYRRLLKGTRAELHVRFADWLERRAPDTAPHDETLGWHLEQAHQHLRELGPLDARGRALGERAARHLAAAGQRALARDDLSLAASLLGRALATLEVDDPARADLALDWCEALLAAGDVGPAAAAVAELGRFAGASDRLRAWHTCFAGQLAVLTDPQALRATADAVAAAAEALAAAGDAAGEAKAHSVNALALARLGKIGACEAALDRALAAARRVRDRRRQNAVLASAPLAALWGPSPVTRASGRCLDVVRVLRITQGAPAVEAVALCCQGVLEALRGRGDAARRMIASSRHLVEELGITQRLLEADVFAGLIELIEDDAGAAERCLRAAYDGLRGQGLGIDAAQAAALLGRALLAQGRVAEAEAVSHESEALAGDDLKAAIAWRGVRAEALARRGEHAAAVDFARAAVELAAATDALLDHADARVALAAALHAAGRSAEAHAEEARAIELWEAKGATLLAERARRGAGRTERATREPDAPVRSQRRVRANAATAYVARLDAAIAAGDAEALSALFADDMHVVHYATGMEFGREGALSRFGALLEAEDLHLVHEPLATFGDSLALCHAVTSVSALADDDVAPAGAVDTDTNVLVEVDAHGQQRRVEIFPDERLGDAVARLYERYAELTPEGAERERAAASARTLAPMLRASGPFDPERALASFAEDFEGVDHRSAGFGSGNGARAYLRVLAGVFELADDVAESCDDVLALRPDALLLRRTLSGRSRASGGAFESPTLSLALLNSEGRLARLEVFAVEQQREALARFDALTGAPERPTRRVRANAATANASRMDAAVAAHSLAGFFATIAEGAEAVHHPTGAVYTEREARRAYEAMLEAEGLDFGHEPIATLGDSLALCLGTVSTRGDGRFVARSVEFDFGAADLSSIVLMEVDARGLRRHTEFFANERLGDAVARLYERYAELLPDGPERIRAAAIARAVAILVATPDLDRWATVFAPGIEWVDHRTVGLGSVHGAEAVVRGIGALFQLMEMTSTRIDDVFALRDDAVVLRQTNLGTDRAGGGPVERSLCHVWIFGADGLLVRWEQYEANREAEALDRYDELVAEPPVARFENAASRLMNRSWQSRHDRDWEAMRACFAPSCELNDRRSLVHLRLSGEDFLANQRLLFETTSLRWAGALLATRGDRLALFRMRFEGEALGSGSLVVDHLSIAEVDASGRACTLVLFDPSDLDAAYTELDARHAAGEAAPFAHVSAGMRAFDRAFASRDWDALAARCAPDLVVNDHRLLGWETLRGPEAYVQALRSLVELAPDTRLRLDHVTLSRHGYLVISVWVGSREGGAFEAPSLMVAELDGQARIRRFDQYDLERRGEAQARFDELTVAATPPPRVENAATRAQAVFERCWRERDWEGVAAHFGPGFRMEDRRALVGISLSGADFVANLRLLSETDSSRFHTELLATRGERLALFRTRFSGEIGGGLFEDLHLSLVERDDSGRGTALVIFDLADLDAAYAELDAHYASGEAVSQQRAALTSAFIRAFAARDWDALAALLAPDLAVEDHRLLGWETLHGPAAYIQALGALVELAPDVRLRVDHVTMSGAGFLYFTTWQGTREGGAFETASVIVCELDAQARIRRFDQYDLDQQREARARLDSIGAGAARDPLTAIRSDPLRIPPNAASRAGDRFQACGDAGDWDGLRALFAPTLVWEDRRHLLRNTVDREMAVANARLIREAGARVLRKRLATSGDRLVLEHVRFARDEGAVWEVETLQIIEVDGEGRIVAAIVFDPDDRRAASEEMREHFFLGEGARLTPPGAMEHFRAWHDQDLVRLRATLPDGFWFDDHRRTGAGRIDGPDAYIRSVAALFEQVRDVNAVSLYHVALEAHGSLAIARNFGTLVSGGAVESVFVRLSFYRDGEYSALELFELDDLDAARARFEALRPDPPAVR